MKINNNTFRTLSDKVIVAIAIITYIVGMYGYYTIKQFPLAANLIVTDTQLFGTITRSQHILLFMFIGYFIPNRFLLIMLLGIGWEISEYFARMHFKDAWWGTETDYFKDILANIIGYLIGTIIHAYNI